MKRSSARRPRSRAAGFSMVELLISIAILLIGVVAVAELVPRAIQSNFLFRYDSTALILAQRQLDGMAEQTMTVGNPPVNGTYFFATNVPTGAAILPGGGTAFVCNLGQAPPTFSAAVGPPPALPPNPTTVGAPLVAGTLDIDWNVAQGAVPAGYSVQYRTPDGYLYQLRWNVTTIFGNINGLVRPVAKRIIISARGGPRGQALPPTTITTMVAWHRG